MTGYLITYFSTWLTYPSFLFADILPQGYFQLVQYNEYIQFYTVVIYDSYKIASCERSIG